MKILAFGEILWDSYPDRRCLGGAPLNFAAHLARHGEDAYLLSALGNDELGKDALSQVEKWGIRQDHITVSDDKNTGVCAVTLDDDGIPSYDLRCGVAWDRIPCGSVPDTFDVLYFGTLSLRSEYNFAELKSLVGSHSFREIFVDMNIRPPHYSAETVRFAAENATLLKISDEEMGTVTELLGIGGYADYKSFAKLLSEKFANLRYIIVTLGGDGAYALSRDGEWKCDGKKVEVKSTVGAGDSFSAAFLHKYLGGAPLPEAMDYAATVAAFVVSCYDAVPEYGVENLT